MKNDFYNDLDYVYDSICVEIDNPEIKGSLRKKLIQFEKSLARTLQISGEFDNLAKEFK